LRCFPLRLVLAREETAVAEVAKLKSAVATMRAFVAEFNIYRWAGRMLRDAERLRRRERLSGRFEGSSHDLPGLEA